MTSKPTWNRWRARVVHEGRQEPHRHEVTLAPGLLVEVRQVVRVQLHYAADPLRF
eukprot:CAMPEP_0180418550 /NCGR_PEP_ID=MMETSP1036_2-20121128/1623_1 /TAXON_ID=632150 /ORGANISM="Azadinium spinosum, Strain 3D9" /LENGTH=54 /DNA_ID=CAMNT_0022423647 /DNA_START=510 /DNA_END=671 /DNA_ORIENTATION=+